MTARDLLWRACYELLAGRVRTREWSFMNYGFAPIPRPALPLHLEPEDEPDRLAIQLYRHTVTAPDLAGLDVLEVGSGRGGGSSWLARSLGPRSTTGLDFSARAVALSSSERTGPGLRFVRGDAQAMPFPDDAFDAVVNVESSHCYGSMEAFLAEVARVLRPGGVLYWADFRDRADLPELSRQLSEAPLTLEERQDITAHVLEALRLDNARKLALIEAWIPRVARRPFHRFAAVQGSTTYERFASGQRRYLSARLVKPGP